MLGHLNFYLVFKEQVGRIIACIFKFSHWKIITAASGAFRLIPKIQLKNMLENVYHFLYKKRSGIRRAVLWQSGLWAALFVCGILFKWLGTKMRKILCLYPVTKWTVNGTRA